MRFLFVFSLLFSLLHAEQVVLVTGASRGIGLAIVERLAKAGYKVYAGARPSSNREALEKLQADLPGNVEIVSLDVVDDESVEKAVALVLEKEGQIDGLVNNAGVWTCGSVENHSIEDAQKLFEVNFFGVMRMSQAVLPAMRAQKSGRIVQISSRSGFRPLPSLSLYAASKFALEGLSETMAAALTPWNIFVSLIEPGPVATELGTLSAYGKRLDPESDPYRPVFEAAGLLNLVSPVVQQPDEIAAFVQIALEAEKPYFRYQTTKAIEAQAAQRLVDITGLSQIAEWQKVLSH